jgi:site-specific recombinase XerD
MVHWLESLADRGLAPGTRAIRICHVRSYLEWLFEQGTVAVLSRDLLRSSDFPKIPDTLPRPFPIEADREMQRRFLKSDTIYGQALFLMRRSGVRIGELVHLDPGCLETDLHGNTFLKVPLGKLDNERLVPLDKKTRRLTEKLQKNRQSGDPFLLTSHLTRRRVKDLLRETLRESANGLDIPGPVVPHRLRHTYATELLNAGMSLVAIMKLLGHRSLRMTMRYAAITQETVVKDYHSAMGKIAEKYQTQSQFNVIDAPDPQRMLQDTISWLRNNAPEAKGTPRLIKRLYRIQNEIAHLNKQPTI